MAHGTRINGVAYGIAGGKCMVGGTQYAIKKGRALVGGTGYDVSFVKNTTIIITGEGIRGYVEVSINKKTYLEPATLVFSPGESVEVDAYGNGGVYVNGELMEDYYYVFKVTGICNIVLGEPDMGITITTE